MNYYAILLLLVTVTQAYADFSYSLCLCDRDAASQLVVGLDGDLADDDGVCFVQNGVITDKFQFITFTRNLQVAVIPLEELPIAPSSLCEDDKTRLRRFLFSHHTSVDTDGHVSHTVGVDAHVGKVGVGGSVTVGKNTIGGSVSGSYGAGSASLGYEHGPDGHKVSGSIGVSGHLAGVGGGVDVHGSYSSKGGLSGGVGGSLDGGPAGSVGGHVDVDKDGVHTGGGVNINGKRSEEAEEQKNSKEIEYFVEIE